VGLRRGESRGCRRKIGTRFAPFALPRDTG
jgi:hypothetical protein